MNSEDKNVAREVAQEHEIFQYLHDQLDDKTNVEFEERLMREPDLLEQTELHAMFKKYVPLIDEHNAVKTKHSFFRWFSDNAFKWQYAASMAIAFVFGALLMPNFMSEQQQNLHGKNIEIVYVSPLRSTTSQPDMEIVLSEVDTTLLLVLQPRDTGDEFYQVSIVNESEDKTLMREENFRASQMGEILVPIDDKTLGYGLIRVEYTPLSRLSEPESVLIKRRK